MIQAMTGKSGIPDVHDPVHDPVHDGKKTEKTQLFTASSFRRKSYAVMFAGPLPMFPHTFAHLFGQRAVLGGEIAILGVFAA